MQKRCIERTKPVFRHLSPSAPLPDAGTPERHAAFSSSSPQHPLT
jgi:hypothetical protein